MPRPLQTIGWRDFLGEYDGVPAEAQHGQAAVVQNLYKDREALKRRKGFTPLGIALSPAQSHDGLHWYKIASTEYLVAAHNGLLHDWLAGATVTNSTGKLTSGADANAAWLDAKMYWGDGILQNIRHDGTDAMQVLTQAPSTAPTLANGGGSGPTGTYTYYVTFTSDDGNHSELSPLSGSITVANDQINLSSIPTCPAGQDCAGRGIWRNKNGTTTYYLVTVIANNTATTYSDTATDAQLGIALTTVLGANLQNARFPPCRYLIAHQSRLVGAFSAAAGSDKQTVYLSNAREPWYCPLVPDLDDPNQGSRFTLQGPGAGEVTGLASHGNQVAVFTADAAWLLTSSDQLLDYTLHKFCLNGCVAHRTIVSIKDVMIWASTDGIYMAREGQGVTRISDDVKNTYQAISAADLAKSFAFVFDDRYYFVWPSGCRVYDLRYGIWTRVTGWNWLVATVTSLGSALEKVYAAQNGIARVFQLENGTTDNEVAVTGLWTSHDFDCGMPGRQKRLIYANFRWKAASGTVTVRFYRGSGSVAFQTATHDLSSVDDTGGTVSSLRQRLSESARSEWFRVECEYSGSASDFQLLGLDVQFAQIT